MDTTRTRRRLDRRGQGLVEYVAIVALIGAGLVLVLGVLGKATTNAYSRTASTVTQQTELGLGNSGGGGGGGGGGGVPYVPATRPKRPPADSGSASQTDPSGDPPSGASTTPDASQ